MHVVSPPITSLVYYIATYYSKTIYRYYCQQHNDIVDLECQYIVIILFLMKGLLQKNHLQYTVTVIIIIAKIYYSMLAIANFNGLL